MPLNLGEWDDHIMEMSTEPRHMRIAFPDMMGTLIHEALGI